jgi:endo-1,4-beta-D-glucanase Y
MTRTTIPVFVLLVLATSISGQHKPFPQNIDYPFGYKPVAITASLAESEYTRWKGLYLVPCDTMYRVATTSYTQTLSEGTGYGMILTAYFGEQDLFDGLLAFYQSKITSQAKYLMAWDVTCDDFNDRNCATDGDLDVAYALLVAYNQWEGKYLKEAYTILDRIKKNFIISCGDTVLAIRPGAGWGGCNLTDISYYSPGYFRVFAEITGDTMWNKLADDTYVILNASADKTTGLVPDWQSVSGIPSGNPPQSNWIGYYRYDASRVPWRIGLDYLWNGDTLARNWCTRVTNWAGGIGPSNIVDGYDLDGGVRGQYHNSAFVGGFTIGAMCNNQTLVNNFASELVGLNDSHYFNLSVRCLYLLAASGNFWEPQTEFVELTSIIVSGENNKDSITTDKGTLQMEAIVSPDSAFDKTVHWSVINGTGKAIISEGGLLTARTDGTVTVVATAHDPGQVTGEMIVTLTNQVPLVEEITIVYDESFPIIGTPGGTMQLSVEALPDNAVDKSVSWSISSGTELATISDSGLVTAVADGEITVVATAKDGSLVTGELIIFIINQESDVAAVQNPFMKIYPNPVRKLLFIDDASLIKKIEVIKMNGEVSMIIRNDSNDHLSINTAGLISGMYILKIYTTYGQVLQSKLVKQ